MQSRPPFVFFGPGSPLAENTLERATKLGWRAINCQDVDSTSSALEVGRGTGCWVIDPGTHPIDAGRATETSFEAIERTLPLLTQGAQVILVSSSHVFPGNRARTPVDAPRAPLSDHGRRLVDLEDMVLARGGAILRLGRVLNVADPLLTRWRNGLKEGVPVSPFAEGRCSPLTVEAAADALFDALGTAPAVYQISGPDEVSYLEIAQRLCAAMGLPADRVVASSVTPSALDLDDWPRHVSLEPTPNLLSGTTPTCDQVVDAAIKHLLA
jgi:nucleoside-diphosphate-sugar epimerase